MLISPHTHSQNIHCQYPNHSHLNFKAKYCSNNTNSHFLPLAVTIMAYTSTTTRTYSVYVSVFDKHYFFFFFGSRTVSGQNNVTKCYKTFLSHNTTVIRHTQWQGLITVLIFAATVLSAAKAAVTYKLWPLMWSDAWRRNGKLWLQKTSGYIFNFPNHDQYFRTTEQKFQAFVFWFISNTLKINYEKNTKIWHHYRQSELT